MPFAAVLSSLDPRPLPRTSLKRVIGQTDKSRSGLAPTPDGPLPERWGRAAGGSGMLMSVIGALVVELHFPACRSLKEKRAVLRPVIDGARSRFAVAVAEADYQDLHQRSLVEVAAAAASERVVVETLDAVERFIWSLPGLEVVGATRRWLDDG